MASPFPITKVFVSYKITTFISAFYIQPLEKNCKGTVTKHKTVCESIQSTVLPFIYMRGQNLRNNLQHHEIKAAVTKCL